MFSGFFLFSASVSGSGDFVLFDSLDGNSAYFILRIS